MSLSFIELNPPIPVSEKGTYSTNRWYEIFDAAEEQKQVISPGEQVDITPDVLRRQRRFQLYGHTYEVLTHEDGTGTLRLHANSGASWATVPGENKLIRVYGSHIYTIAPEPVGHEVFPIFRRANRKLELIGAIVWEHGAEKV